MILGLDYHGVIDKYPELFRELSWEVFDSELGEVHIITGELDTEEFRTKLRILGIRFTHLFSISSYHQALGTKIWFEDGRPWMDAETWNRTKADYCREHEIDLHIDDSMEYGKYFTTPFLLMKKEALPTFCEITACHINKEGSCMHGKCPESCKSRIINCKQE
jgi:hypothetical protein